MLNFGISFGHVDSSLSLQINVSFDIHRPEVGYSTGRVAVSAHPQFLPLRYLSFDHCQCVSCAVLYRQGALQCVLSLSSNRNLGVACVVGRGLGQRQFIHFGV